MGTINSVISKSHFTAKNFNDDDDNNKKNMQLDE